VSVRSLARCVSLVNGESDCQAGRLASTFWDERVALCLAPAHLFSLTAAARYPYKSPTDTMPLCGPPLLPRTPDRGATHHPYMQRPLSRNDYDATIVVFRFTRGCSRNALAGKRGTYVGVSSRRSSGECAERACLLPCQCGWSASGTRGSRRRSAGGEWSASCRSTRVRP
jgi:hypothetical protein